MGAVMMMKLRLRQLREEMGLTQKQVAQYLMYAQSTYSKYEREERSLPMSAAVKLADLYHTSIDYLAGRRDNREPYSKSRRK